MQLPRAVQTALLSCALLAVGVGEAGILPGCARHPEPAALPTLQLRASFDLACPPQDVQMFHFDRRTKGVVGCGRRLIYVASCDDAFDKGACTWVLDSPASWPASASVGAPMGARAAAPAPQAWPAAPSAPVPTSAAPPPGAPARPAGPTTPPPPGSGTPPVDPELSQPDFGF
jgi:hypothetical protein